MPLPFNEDLAKVAEIGFGEPMEKNTVEGKKGDANRFGKPS